MQRFRAWLRFEALPPRCVTSVSGRGTGKTHWRVSQAITDTPISPTQHSRLLVDQADPYWQSNEGIEIVRRHDALIAAYVRRLSAGRFGLIETYPGQAFPTDVAAVAGAIAVHGRITHKDYSSLLFVWATRVRTFQLDPVTGMVKQRMNAFTGASLDDPRGSGTGLAAYFAGFADRALAAELADALLRQERSFLGFSAIREYAPGVVGSGDIDSGPVLFGVSVAATGFAIAPARSLGHREAFMRIYRTVDLFGMPAFGDGFRFRTGGQIGNALMFAFLTSGPELAEASKP
jgi:hypothetical protein